MTRLLAVRRHNEILKRIEAAGAVSVAELADAFAVSHETIRRDLKHLADHGRLDIVHGGAARRGVGVPAFATQGAENGHGKMAIAKAAAKLVRQGCTILIDSGSITGALVSELTHHSGLTVCTNSLSHALALCRVPGNRVHMLGGEIEPNNGATISLETAEAVRAFQVDVAFIEIDGFAEDGGATDTSRVVAELHGRMALAGTAYLVADHIKFGQRPPFRMPHFDRIKGIIVDRLPEKNLLAAWHDHGIRPVVAG